MTGMEHAIERVAVAIKPVLSNPNATLSLDHFARHIARALAEAGLLAPAPLTEEFGAQVRGGVRTLPDGYRDVGSHHRYVTEWLPVDGVDRAEGTGGKAATDG